MLPHSELTPPRGKTDITKLRFLTAWLVLAFWVSLSALSAAASGDWTFLAERLSTDGFPRHEVEGFFVRPEVVFHPDVMTGKLKELLQARDREANPPAAVPRSATYRGFLTNQTINRALAFARENRALLQQATSRHQVPMEIIVSILLVETRLGDETGQHFAFNRLASMAACRDLEIVRPYLALDLVTAENEAFLRRHSREKADWAYEELKALLLYARREGIDPISLRGSMYGAIGLCQFMPSNLLVFGIDADGDGRLDPFSKPDAMHSIANYLRCHGWRDDLDRESQRKVIFAYNHSTIYVNTVLAIAERMREQRKP